MISNRLPARFYRFPLLQYAWSLAVLILLSIASLCLAQNPGAPKSEKPASVPAALSSQAAPAAPRQQSGKNSANEKAKADVGNLSALADQLRDQLNKLNVNVLSLDVIQKTETIEKLAKKIKGEADVR